MSTLLKKWEPENPQFWKETGSKIAWRTLVITTFSLLLSFATWFVISAVVVRLPQIGFKFDTMQLFWLAAMPGLAGGTFRAIHSFLIPILGTRLTITVATFIKLIPILWLGFAVMNPETPYWHFLVIALLCGMGGGDFSSFMPSTSLFFPKKLQGTALGIQAGIGNLGVSITQFITPWIIGFAIVGIAGAPHFFTTEIPVKLKVVKEAGVVKDVMVKKDNLAKVITVVKDEAGAVKDVVITDSDLTKGMHAEVVRDNAGVVTDVHIETIVKKSVWLQNAAFWYVPFLVVWGIVCFIGLRSVPVRASFKEQLDIFKDKHTWFCTVTYVMTFGSFAGLAASFPLMIKIIYGGFDDAPDPLKYAFLGPLIGSLIRAAGGPLSDKWGGSIFTQISGIGLIIGCIALIFGGLLTPTSLSQFPYFVGVMLWLFLMSGIGNFSTFRQFPIVFARSPRQAAGVLGWTGAVAAYGPFIFSFLIGASITATGSAITFFAGSIVFYVIATAINWWYYTKNGSERYDWGSGRTWWERYRYLNDL